eukprot:439524-Hanusia_phi.AAC.1
MRERERERRSGGGGRGWRTKIGKGLPSDEQVSSHSLLAMFGHVSREDCVIHALSASCFCRQKNQ